MFNFLGFPFIAAGISSSWAPSLIYLHWHVGVLCVVLSLVYPILGFPGSQGFLLTRHISCDGPWNPEVFLIWVFPDLITTWEVILNSFSFPFFMCLGGILDRVTLFLPMVFPISLPHFCPASSRYEIPSWVYIDWYPTMKINIPWVSIWMVVTLPSSSVHLLKS